MNEIMKIENVYKDYSIRNKQISVLKNINLEIENGKITFILGPSGAGKSTLLHIMGTLDTPTKGKVYYKNTDLFSLNDKKLSDFRNTNIGFIFQFHYLLNDFNAYENVLLPYLFKNKNKNNIKYKIEELFKELGIIDRMYHKPNELSGGEQQRIAIARAIINQPSIVLADEPTGNLDSKNTHFAMNFIKKLNTEQNMTFVIITHNRELIQYADRIINIKDGEIIIENHI